MDMVGKTKSYRWGNLISGEDEMGHWAMDAVKKINAKTTICVDCGRRLYWDDKNKTFRHAHFGTAKCPEDLTKTYIEKLN